LFPNSAGQFEGINEEAVGEPHCVIVDEGHGVGNLQVTFTIFTPLHDQKSFEEVAGIVMLWMVDLWLPVYLHTLKDGLFFPSQDDGTAL